MRAHLVHDRASGRGSGERKSSLDRSLGLAGKHRQPTADIAPQNGQIRAPPLVGAERPSAHRSAVHARMDTAGQLRRATASSDAGGCGKGNVLTALPVPAGVVADEKCPPGHVPGG